MGKSAAGNAIRNGKAGNQFPLTNGHVDHSRTATSEEPKRELSADERQRLQKVTIIVGLWQLGLAVITIIATFYWWPLVAQTASGTAGVGLLGLDFNLTAASGALLIGLAGGVAGSLVHTIAIFSSRVGQDTLETSYVWWYILRPFEAALLALLFVAALNSGLIAISGGAVTAGQVVPFVAGGLAGLFTDAVLQKMRSILGATSTEEPASQQELPLGPRPALKKDAAESAA